MSFMNHHVCGTALALILFLGLGSQTGQASPSTFVGISGAEDLSTQDVGENTHAPSENTYQSFVSRAAPALPSELERARQAILKNLVFTRPMRLGIEQDLGQRFYSPMVLRTKELLTRMFGYANVNVLYLSRKDLAGAVHSGEVDFFIADAPFFAMEKTLTHVEPLATLWPKDSLSPAEAIGSTILMRKIKGQNRAPNLHSLREHPVVAGTEDSIGGWLAAAEELHRHHADMKAGIDDVVHYTGRVDKIFDMLQTNPNTIGIVPACALEERVRAGQDKIDNYWIINAKKGENTRCVHSTALYPGWVFAATAQADPTLRKAVSTVLFTMNRDADGGEWALPVSNRAIYDLFYTLKIGPYRDLGRWSLERFVRENAEIMGVGLLALVLILTYATSLSVLVRRRTKLLRAALEDRDRADNEANQARQHIATLERTGIVGQMSTIIAHELKQPLGAVNNYANGLLRRLARGNLDQAKLEEILHEVVRQTSRASEIVERVRAYAKHDFPPREVTDVSTIIENAISNFRRARKSRTTLVVRMKPDSLAEADAWELELLIFNLLKNAADALVDTPEARIDVVLTSNREGRWVLTVADNGPYLSDEELEDFFKPLQTTKGDAGLGLGLSIVASIVERHAGHISVGRNGQRGVKFTIVFPRTSDPLLLEKVPLPSGPDYISVYEPDKPPVRRKVVVNSFNSTGQGTAGGLLEALNYGDSEHINEGGVPTTVHSTTLGEALALMQDGSVSGHMDQIRRQRRRILSGNDTPMGTEEKTGPDGKNKS